MTKNWYICMVLFLQMLNSTAQDPSAAMQVSSTTQGFLPPQMTQNQRDVISNPAPGLLLYNTTSQQLENFDGSQWDATGTDSQTLTLIGNTLAISSGNSVTLALTNTDSQTINGFLIGTDLKLSNQNTTITKTIDLSPLVGTDSQTLHFGSSATATQTTLQISKGNSLTLQVSGGLSFSQAGTHTLLLEGSSSSSSGYLDATTHINSSGFSLVNAHTGTKIHIEPSGSMVMDANSLTNGFSALVINHSSSSSSINFSNFTGVYDLNDAKTDISSNGSFDLDYLSSALITITENAGNKYLNISRFGSDSNTGNIIFIDNEHPNQSTLFSYNYDLSNPDSDLANIDGAMYMSVITNQMFVNRDNTNYEAINELETRWVVNAGPAHIDSKKLMVMTTGSGSDLWRAAVAGSSNVDKNAVLGISSVSGSNVAAGHSFTLITKGMGVTLQDSSSVGVVGEHMYWDLTANALRSENNADTDNAIRLGMVRSAASQEVVLDFDPVYVSAGGSGGNISFIADGGTVPSGNEGDEYFVTSDGTSSGTIEKSFIHDGSAWVERQQYYAAEYGTKEHDITTYETLAAGSTKDILTFTIPSAGTYEITTHGSLGVGLSEKASLYVENPAGTAIEDSESVFIYPYATSVNLVSTAGKTFQLEATAAGTYTLVVECHSGTVEFFAVAENPYFVSWNKISGHLPVTDPLQAEYIELLKNTAQTNAGAGTDINFSEGDKQSLSLQSNNTTVTLKAGVTYELLANMSGTTFSDTTNGWVTIEWVDSANQSLGGNKAVLIHSDAVGNQDNSPTAMAIFTPTVDTDVKLRIDAGAGTVSIRDDLASATIKSIAGENPVSTNLANMGDVETTPHTQQTTVADGATLRTFDGGSTWEADVVEGYANQNAWFQTPWGLSLMISSSAYQAYWRNDSGSAKNYSYTNTYHALNGASGNGVHSGNIANQTDKFVWGDNTLNLTGIGDHETMRFRWGNSFQTGNYQEFEVLMVIGGGYNNNFFRVKRLK